MDYEGHAVSEAIEYQTHIAYGAILEGLLAAVRRLKESVNIRLHVNNAVLAAQIRQQSFNLWNRRDGRTARGQPVSDWDLWTAIYMEIAMTNSVLKEADTEIPKEKRDTLRIRIKRPRSR